MDRRNELAIRAMVARAERHGWRCSAISLDGYYVERVLPCGRKVTLYASRRMMKIGVWARI